MRSADIRAIRYSGIAVSLGLALSACSDTGLSHRPVALTPVLGDQQDGNVGQPLSLPFMVQVTDAQGVAVADVEVSWNVVSGDGALDGVWEDCSQFDNDLGDPLSTTSVRTDGHGLAWVSFVPAWFGRTVVAAEAERLEGPPVQFGADAADSGARMEPEYPFQEGAVREVIAGVNRHLDLQVRVTDSHGIGAPGVPVTWEVTSGGGKFSGAAYTCSSEKVGSATMIARTGHDHGYGQVSFLPTAYGITTITATVPGANGSPATFTLDATLLEVVLTTNAYDEPKFLGPDLTSNVTVPVGATVDWRNLNASARIVSTSVPSGAPSLDSGVMGKGDHFRFVPPVPGTWVYVDQVSGATGTLTAEAQS